MQTGQLKRKREGGCFITQVVDIVITDDSTTADSNRAVLALISAVQ